MTRTAPPGQDNGAPTTDGAAVARPAAQAAHSKARTDLWSQAFAAGRRPRAARPAGSQELRAGGQDGLVPSSLIRWIVTSRLLPACSLQIAAGYALLALLRSA